MIIKLKPNENAMISVETDECDQYYQLCVCSDGTAILHKMGRTDKKEDK